MPVIYRVISEINMIKKFLAGLFATSIASASFTQEKWGVYTAQDNGFPLIVRHRSDIPTNVISSAYPHMIAISWKYESENGMPEETVRKSMKVLEDRITNAVEPRKHALLTVVVTGNGLCEWQFYARNTNDFMQLLNEALANQPAYPIELSLQKDPEWEAYRQFIDTGT